MPDSQERSVSGDLELDSDDESHFDSANPPGKPGRKKNPNSQAARRDQNRIAQREFRLRKQQRIRDLEARVEILSGGKEEALGQMKNILKDLMTENQTLRNLLRSLSSFIGDGAGGLLPKLGWDMADFNNFVNKSETDTAWESYQRKKKQTGPSGSTSATQVPKRQSDDDFNGGPSKKPKASEGDDGERERETYPVLMPPVNTAIPPVPASNLFPSSSRTQENGLFSEILRGPSGSPMFMQPSPPASSSGQYSATSSTGLNQYPPYLPSIGVPVESSLPPFSSSSNGSASVRRPSQPLAPDQIDEEEDPKKNEAYKLIHYHLDNYKRNSAYCLPASLRPTLVQRTVPHESVIDRILHPELRDRMILLRGRFDLVDCLLDYRAAVTIHGDDVLAHSNWEINETWLRKYGFLVDQPTLNVANRWRRERSEPEIRISELGGSESNST